MTTILLDSAMPYWEEYFANEFDVHTFVAGDLTVDANGKLANESLRHVLAEVDYLLVRSTTSVNASLMALAPKLKFVGTATAGFDHFDLMALKARQIPWYAAGGCNAQAVSQYTVCALLQLASDDGFLIQDQTIAIVGHGNVGSKVADALRAFGANIIIYDPPQASLNPALELSYATFDDVLQADIICIHAPLDSHKAFPSKHLFDQKTLHKISSKQYIINAGRGEIIDNQALLTILKNQTKQKVPCLNIVLDVWENEPKILRDLIPFLRLTSPHIAGHTLEGKANGTHMLYEQVCRLEKRPIEVELATLLPLFKGVSNPTAGQYELKRINHFEQQIARENTLSPPELQNLIHYLCQSIYKIKNDDSVFRRHMAQSTSFAEIRRSYPIRREFSALPVNTPYKKINELLAGLGFIISNDRPLPLLTK